MDNLRYMFSKYFIFYNKLNFKLYKIQMKKKYYKQE